MSPTAFLLAAAAVPGHGTRLEQREGDRVTSRRYAQAGSVSRAVQIAAGVADARAGWRGCGLPDDEDAVVARDQLPDHRGTWQLPGHEQSA